MSRKSLFAAAILALVAAFAGGCGGGSSPSAPSSSQDSISIVTITPASGTKLAPGSAVVFTATVNYQLASAGSASIFEVISDQNSHLLTTGAQSNTTISRGQGSATLSDHITVPATGVVQVFVDFPLTPAGANTSSAVATAAYTVGP
ncbi:MAG TPA: hypothetical protein VHQ90_21990 [Thermoanaerobaculia bacterium]|nr:hypothetical protein [Thermoanaerobaculia bacterium]